MSLTQAAIRRPVFIVMFVLALVTMGYLSRSRMPQELNPKIDFPMVTVSTVYAGAGPNEIESLVTEPIEKAVSSIGHLKDVTSISQDSVSNVMLQFELGTDLEAAAADIRDKVSSIQSQLPKDADKSRILKLDIAAQPIMTIGLAGPLSPRDMRILADDVVSERLAKVGGVAGVSVLGGQQRELSVAVDKERLEAYGLGIGSVAEALHSANMNLPAGSVQEESRNYSVRTVGSYTSLQDIKDALIALPGGPGSIHVSDVARVTDTVAEPNIMVRLNGQPSVVLSIQKQSDANTVAVADGVKKELATLERELPKGVHYVISSDQSTAVKDALRDVNKSLLEGILLVVLIVFLFLHSARATFIVALAIPTSLMATFFPTAAFGFTQNSMLLLGLSLSVGILVDDSIVVLENIERHLRMREHPEEAAANGRSEIGLAAIAITLVDVAVFLPIAFMGGIAGQFFRQFGITVACATAFSLLMSFTLTPMLASRLMSSEEEKEKNEEALERRRASGSLTIADRFGLFSQWLFSGLDSFLHGLDLKYRSLLEWALHNRFLTLVIGNVSLLAVFALAMPMPKGGVGFGPRMVIAFIALGVSALAMAINRKSKGVAIGFGVAVAVIALTIYLPFGFGFFPQSDQGQFSVTVRTAPGTSLATTERVVAQVEEIINQLPELKTVTYQVSDSVWYNPFTWFKHHSESKTGYSLALVGTESASGYGSSGSQYGTLSVQLVDKAHRKRGLNDIMDWVAARTARIPGAEMISVASSESMGPGNALSREIRGQNMDAILAEARLVADVMRKIPGAVDVDISYKPTVPGRRIVVDRVKVSQLGLSLAQVASAARTALSGDDSVKFRENGTEYPIRVRYDLSQRDKITDVDHLIVGTKNGAPIYLTDVAKVVYEQAPAKIDRKNRQRIVTVSANVATGFELGNVNQVLERELRKVPVVPGTTLSPGGSTQMMMETFGYMGAAVGLSVLLVYMLMSALFESMLTPFVIMFCLPQAMIGALLALLLTGTSMGVTAMIGIIMLIGLVMKNAILLIDYTNTLMGRGKSRHEALLEAGETRLRPILMTTLAMIGGMMPTALALSEGSEMRAPMAIAVIGGLIVSTLLTLVVIPVVFTLMDDVWQAVVKRFFPRFANRGAAAPTA